MSDTTLTPDAAADQAREILEADVDKRVEAVRTAAAAAIEVDTAEQQLQNAAASYDTAFRAAVTAGWTEKDLKAAGLRSPSPATPRTRRRRKRRRRTGLQAFGLTSLSTLRVRATPLPVGFLIVSRHSSLAKGFRGTSSSASLRPVFHGPLTTYPCHNKPKARQKAKGLNQKRRAQPVNEPHLTNGSITASSSSTDTVGYLVPVDPMDELQCDSCQ